MAITSVQLLHVDRLLEARGTRSTAEFLKLLDERTPILGFFRWRWDTGARMSGKDPSAFATARECFLERLSETISTTYASRGPEWHTQLTACLQKRHEELDAMFGAYEEQYARNTHDWQRIGAIQVAPPRPIEALLGRYPKLIESLIAHGLSPDMQAIQVHVPTRFTQGESPWEPGKTILQLGPQLRAVERHYGALGIRALFGLSWQFDSVLGTRLGFTVVDSPDLPQNIMGAWYQLLNEDGSFNNKRLAYLLEHNALPYRLKCGFKRLG